jgi:site-specific recombinase XerD
VSVQRRPGSGLEVTLNDAPAGAARQFLSGLERKAELVRPGVMSASEAVIARHQARPLGEHIDAFEQHLRAKGVTKVHREDTKRYLQRLAEECSFVALPDLRREALERWLAGRSQEGMSARTRNAYRNALVSFCNWCVATDRLAPNPFGAVPKANEKAGPRRQRRALTEEELTRLLAVANAMCKFSWCRPWPEGWGLSCIN